MTIYGCPRVDDAASYVLRAMEDGEWEAYELHLTGCEACADKVAELGFVSHALFNAVPQLTAPPVVRDRVMSVVRSEASLLRAAGPMADRPEPQQPRRRFSVLALRPLPAAALACAVLALGVGSGVLLTGTDDPRITPPLEAPVGVTARFEQSSDGAKLVVARMPTPPEGRIYQVWLDHDNGQVPAPTNALFSVRHGSASVDVPGDLKTVKRVLVTDEPLGGSEVPTRQPVMKFQLT